MNNLITVSKFLVKQFGTFDIAHLSKFIVNFNLMMLSKPKYALLSLTFFFFFFFFFSSVVASGTSHFYSFRKWFWQELIFWYDNYGLWPWQAKPRPKTKVNKVQHLFCINSYQFHEVILLNHYVLFLKNFHNLNDMDTPNIYYQNEHSMYRNFKRIQNYIFRPSTFLFRDVILLW